MPKKNSKKSEGKKYLEVGAGVALLGIAAGIALKQPRASAAARRFKKNVGPGMPIWFASKDVERMESLGITYKSEAKSLGLKVKPVIDLKEGEKITGGGFFGHRGDMTSQFPTDAALAKAKTTGKIYNKPSITRELEDNWKWYNQVKGEGIPKTILGSSVKSAKEAKKIMKGDFMVKSRIGWGNRGIIEPEEIKANPAKYFTDKFIVQKKVPIKREYRALVAEGETVYVVPRNKGEFVYTPSPHRALEKDRIAIKAQEIVGRAKKHKYELHSLDMGVTDKGKIISWENNAAQGGNMFIEGPTMWDFKRFASGEKAPTYTKRALGSAAQLIGVGAGATTAGIGIGKLKNERKMRKTAAKKNNLYQDIKEDRPSKAALKLGIGTAATGGAILAAEHARVKSEALPAGVKKRIAILTPSIGGGAGHMSTGAALKAGFEARGYEAKLITPKTKEPNRILKAIAERIPNRNEKIQKNLSEMSSTTIKSTKPSHWIIEKGKQFIVGTAQEFKAITTGEGNRTIKSLQKYRPERVISTFFGDLPPLRDTNKAIDLIGTDYEVRPALWKNQNVGTYFMPSQKATANLKRYGLKNVKNIKEIPVHPAKYKNIAYSTATKPKNIVVMGGSLGLRVHEMGKLVSDYYKGDPGRKITLLAGKENTLARKELSKMKLHKNVSVMEAGKDITKIMREADLVITRPGGATTAEVRAMGKVTMTFTENPASQVSHEGGNVRKLLSTGQSRHLELSGIVPDRNPHENLKRVSKELSYIDRNFRTMQRSATKASIEAIKNQSSLISTILGTAPKINKETSLLNKATRGLGIAGLGVGAIITAAQVVSHRRKKKKLIKLY